MLDIYATVVSPILTALLGHACRFHPSCSAYARQAVATHGIARGGYFAIRRLCRCRPGGGWGEDPIPGRGHAAAKL
ncbi:MAG TPA: membrane protein insertion efficiency factor YidD [Candidatus Binataceae bacterium]|nr:membrane protein insertion efficiency factor YidD [Candidatus Binataceae bacterium]